MIPLTSRFAQEYEVDSLLGESLYLDTYTQTHTQTKQYEKEIWEKTTKQRKDKSICVSDEGWGF